MNIPFTDDFPDWRVASYFNGWETPFVAPNSSILSWGISRYIKGIWISQVRSELIALSIHHLIASTTGLLHREGLLGLQRQVEQGSHMASTTRRGNSQFANWKWAIDFIDLPVKNGDFPYLCELTRG